MTSALLVWLDNKILQQFAIASMLSSVAFEYGDVAMAADVLDTMSTMVNGQRDLMYKGIIGLKNAGDVGTLGICSAGGLVSSDGSEAFNNLWSDANNCGSCGWAAASLPAARPGFTQAASGPWQQKLCAHLQLAVTSAACRCRNKCPPGRVCCKGECKMDYQNCNGCGWVPPGAWLVSCSQAGS